MIRDQLTLRQNELRQRQQLNQIRVDVQNALIGLQQSRAQYQAAQKARVLQEQRLDAETKKFAAGMSTLSPIFLSHGAYRWTRTVGEHWIYTASTRNPHCDDT